MAYFLIVLRRSESRVVPTALEREHAGFIDELIARRLVLLGGGVLDDRDELYGAYAVRAADADEARALAQRDRLVRDGLVTCRVLRWNLVAVDPGAVERSLLVSGG